MFINDNVVENDRRMLHVNELESKTLPDVSTQALGPAARDAFVIFEDLFLLGNGDRPQFLQLECLHKTLLWSWSRAYSRTTTNSSARCVSFPLYPSETRMRAVVLKLLSCSQHSEFLIL